jgi:hypothetical protein
MREQGIRPIRGRVSGTIVCGVLLMIALSMRVVWLLTVGTIVGEAMSSLADASLSWAMNTSATYLVPAFAADKTCTSTRMAHWTTCCP